MSTRRSKLFAVYLLPLGFLLSRPALAQQDLFQNSNQFCEAENVLCDSLTAGTCLGNNLHSIACKNIDGGVDFNGDGFTDCAGAMSVEFGPTGQAPFPVVNVLLNQTGSSCGDQFDTALNYTMDLNFNDIGTMLVGQLDGANFDDLAVAAVSSAGTGNNGGNILSAFSGVGGGFGADNSAITSDTVSWSAAVGQNGVRNEIAERSAALLDCDGSGSLDWTMAVRDGGVVNLNVSVNDGGGLQAVLPGASFSTAVPVVSPAPTIAVGFFNTDDFPDIAFLISDSGNSSLGVCLGDGACGYGNCPAAFQVDLDSVHGRVSPTSITAGDFNADGFDDVAIAVNGLLNTPGNENGIDYFFSDGGSFASNQNVPFLPTTDSTRVVTTGCFNNDNVVDVAFSFGQLDSTPSVAGLITSADGGGLNPPLALSAGDIIFADGIDAADFDNEGGDDVIMLAQDQSDQSNIKAFVFMNSVEDFSADAGTDQSIAVGEPLAISGAACSVSIETIGDPARFDVNWTVSPGAGATLSNADTLNPTLTADVPGTYTLTLECLSRCTALVTDTVEVTVLGPTPSPTALPLPGLTQGGCLASLNGEVPHGGNQMIWLLLLLAPAAFLFKKIGMKRSLLGIGAITLLATSFVSHTRADSFSVNTFEPTVDDSEYFTIYNSPTMLKRNFHVGFFLDYAKNPYEFGNANFNRTAGVVDDLLTANIVGSYGVLDWFSVGVLIPVYFWEHIDSPSLLLDENNFDLGDVQLVFKVRLLDREKHHVGISIVPFVSFPSSTGSSDFLGNDSFAGGGKVVIDGRIKDRVSLALNLGYLTRTRVVDVSGNVLNDQFLAGLGISIDILKEKLKLIGEAQVATVTSDFFSDRRTTPAEARVGFRYTWAKNHDINAGAGFGLSNGIGSPDYRIFAGYTYTKRPIQNVVMPPPAINEVQVGDELTLQDKIYFEFDKAVIRDISKPTLDKIAGFLKIHPEVTKIRIDGYTCDLGTDPYNLRLSQKRSKAAADYLIGQDIDPSRIGTVEGFGEKNPLVPNTDEPHREQNRRVQIFVEAVNKGNVTAPAQ